MNTPTLPHVSLPSDALATGLDRVQDLAAAAADVLDDIPDKAIALAGAVIPALRPSPRRSKRPFVLIAAAVATCVVVAWLLKRRGTTAEPYAMPVATDSEAKVSAAS